MLNENIKNEFITITEGSSILSDNYLQNVFIILNEEIEELRQNYDKSSNNLNKNKENKDHKDHKDNDKEKNVKMKENNYIDIDNLIIALLKNVEKKYFNK